jgi:hypothetical protein
LASFAWEIPRAIFEKHPSQLCGKPEKKVKKFRENCNKRVKKCTFLENYERKILLRKPPGDESQKRRIFVKFKTFSVFAPRHFSN